MTYNAGWYPDTSHAGMDRYYDGQAWTSHWQPSATAAPGAVVPTYAAPVPAYTEANTRTVAVSTSRGPNTAVIVIAWIIAVLSLGYMLPWAIAATRNSSTQWAVFAVNLLLGWTFLGWIAALVMAVVGGSGTTNVVVMQTANPVVYVQTPPTAPVPSPPPTPPMPRAPDAPTQPLEGRIVQPVIDPPPPLNWRPPANG